jgi:hypothetical protein
MANTIRIKRSAVENKVPNTGDLQLGELAINTFDGKLYTKKDNGTVTIVEIGAREGQIGNVDIAEDAAIVDTKLATISTVGKVSNSATTAASANTANAIVARDASGNFSAGTITAALTGNASTATTLATARTINGTSFNGSANITTANWGTARTLTFGATGKSVNGGTNVSWTLAEIGVNNSTLTLATSGIATGSQTWTSNQGSDATFTVNVPATNLAITAGTTAGPVVTSSTGTNATLPTATGSNSGVVTTGNQTFAGIKTFSSTIVGSISGNAGSATDVDDGTF